MWLSDHMKRLTNTPGSLYLIDHRGACVPPRGIDAKEHDGLLVLNFQWV